MSLRHAEWRTIALFYWSFPQNEESKASLFLQACNRSRGCKARPKLVEWTEL